MPTGIEPQSVDEQGRRKTKVNRWHRVGHTVFAFPGIAIAYFVGAMSDGRFSAMTILAVIFGLEILTLLIAYVGFWLSSKR